jgi:septal ring-binding cell division protein DamX
LILFLAVVVGGFALIPKDNTAIQAVAIEPKPLLDKVEQVSTRDNANAPLISKSSATHDEVEMASPNLVNVVETANESQAPLASEEDPEQKPEPVQEAIARELNAPVQLVNEDPNAWINNLPATAAGSRASELTAIEPGEQLQREMSAQGQADWLQQADPAAYTLQILGSHDEGSIRAFMAKHPDLEHFGYFETRHLNQPWFVLTYGRYANRDEAVNAIPRLEAGLKAQKPWARGVRTIRGS